MTLYHEPHNARYVVRDSDERVLLVNAIARTLALSVVSPSRGVNKTRRPACFRLNPNNPNPLDLRPRSRSFEDGSAASLRLTLPGSSGRPLTLRRKAGRDTQL